MGRFPKQGMFARNPLLPYAYLSGNGDMYVIIALSRLCREESLNSCRVAPVTHFPFPPPPCALPKTRTKHNYVLPFAY